MPTGLWNKIKWFTVVAIITTNNHSTFQFYGLFEIETHTRNIDHMCQTYLHKLSRV